MKISFPFKFKKTDNEAIFRKKDEKPAILFKKILEKIGNNLFLSSLFMIILAMIFGGYFFYKYIFSLEKIEPAIIQKPFAFDEKVYKKIIDKWQDRDKKFLETDLKLYPDLFKPVISPLAE